MRRAAAYFTRTGPRTFMPTRHTGGAWSESEQHISPMGGLVVHEMQAHAAARDEQLGTGKAPAITRLSMDILGVLPLEEFDVQVEVIRPGRTVELLEAVVTSGGRPAVRARAWRRATATPTRSQAAKARRCQLPSRSSPGP